MVSSFGRVFSRDARGPLPPARQRQRRPAGLNRPLTLEPLETRTLLTGAWAPLANLAPSPNGTGTMILLSDGTVMAQGGGSAGTTANWYRLTPDASGSYVNGTWSALASMHVERLYYGSAVLPDARVFVVGGEYSSDGGFSRTGEIYDPVANTWTSTASFPQSGFGDDPVEVLPDGRVLGGYFNGPQTYFYDPAADAWSPAATKLRNDQSDEESWVKLPDNSILSYDIFSTIMTGTGHAQRYLPDTDTWVDAGTPPNNLSSTGVGYELGPALLLPDGRVFFLGATGHTAYYTPSTNSWAAGPDIPNGLGADDAPGAELPNGKILFAADRPLFNGPTSVFEFDPTTNTYTNVTPNISGMSEARASYFDRMVVLPTGQVLYTTSDDQLAVYTPDGTAVDAAKPTISDIESNGDGTFTLNGTLLNGISEGATYGDDALMASNYPIVQLTGANGTVYYARTYNWNATGVGADNGATSVQFALPFGISPTHYSLAVVANGIASDPVDFVAGAGPSVINSAPAGGVPAGVSSVRFTFNESILPRTFENVAKSVVSFTDPNDNPITVDSVTPVRGTHDTQFDVNFSAQTQAGTYTLVIGPKIKDFMHRQMDQNENGIAGEVPGDEYTATFTIQGPQVVGLVRNGDPATPPTSVRVTFNEPINAPTFTPGQVSFTDPHGNAIPVTSVTPVDGSNDTQFDVGFDAQTTPGTYTMTVGPDIEDLYGNPMGTTFTGTFRLQSYVAVSNPYEDLEISQTGTALAFTNGTFYADDDYGTINLGADTFTFFGTTYTGANRLFVSSNGLITFGSGNSEFVNTNLGGGDPSQAAIAPLWSDWIKQSGDPGGAMIFYQFQTLGDGSRRLVIEWNRVHHFPDQNDGNFVTFQAILALDTAGNDSFVFNYPNIATTDGNSNGRTATVGIKNAGSTNADPLLISFNSLNPLVQSQQAILVEPFGSGPGPDVTGSSRRDAPVNTDVPIGLGAATRTGTSAAGFVQSGLAAPAVAALDQAFAEAGHDSQAIAPPSRKQDASGASPDLATSLTSPLDGTAWS